jgi:hypothetical protein
MGAPGSATSSQKSDEIGDHGRVDRTQDEPFLSPRFHQASTPQLIDVMRERRAGNTQTLLELAHGSLLPGFHQGEEHVQTPRVRQRLERVDVLGGSVQANQR